MASAGAVARLRGPTRGDRADGDDDASSTVERHAENAQWEPTEGDAKAGLSLPTPNDHEFVRFRDVAGPTLDVTLTHRTYVWP